MELPAEEREVLRMCVEIPEGHPAIVVEPDDVTEHGVRVARAETQKAIPGGEDVVADDLEFEDPRGVPDPGQRVAAPAGSVPDPDRRRSRVVDRVERGDRHAHGRRRDRAHPVGRPRRLREDLPGRHRGHHRHEQDQKAGRSSTHVHTYWFRSTRRDGCGRTLPARNVPRKSPSSIEPFSETCARDALRSTP